MFASNPKANDLQSIDFPDLTWDGTRDIVALETLRKFVVQQAQETSNWYLSHRQGKRYAGRIIRFLALLATLVAGIVPILSQIVTVNGQAVIAPAWASVALSVAAGLVGLDYFFGYSSSWMRDIQTHHKIVHAVHEFQFDWEALRAGWGANPPSQPQVLAALGRLKQTAMHIQQLIQDETDSWITEFRTTLRMIDEAARTKLEVAPRPGMNVAVTNGHQTADGWTLRVDDGEPTRHHGGRASLINLTPGAHKLRVEGTIGERSLCDEATISVPATGVGEATLTLR
jgi:hypothetical protein